MKKVLLVALCILTLSGCTAEKAKPENNAESKTDSQAKTENLTGGSKVKELKSNELMITDTDGDGIMDASKDETLQSIETSGFEYTTKVYDTDGDGVVTGERDNNEAYTQITTLKNNSGTDVMIDDMSIYLQNADDETIKIESIEAGSMNSDNFVADERSGDTISYKDDETYDQFTFPKDEELKIVTTQEISGSKSSLEPAELRLEGKNKDGVWYYIESSKEFASK